MDNWVKKKKAAETCGGLGMAKYIDSSEATRLKRLKNIKSTIGNKTSHNGWQKQQIEKRRKDQLRRRKEDAKRKPLGGGIQVDTKISKGDAVSKCGLKLKAAFITKTQGKTKDMVPPQRKKTHEVVAEQQDEKGDGERHLSLRRRYYCDPIEQANISNNSVMIPRMSSFPELCTLKKTNPSRTKQQKKGKENNDDSNSKECTAAAVDVAVFPTKKTTASSIPSNNKKYFMDIDSLKREHAAAMKMLEDLDVSEGENRLNSLLLDSENNASTASYSGEDDNNDIDGCENDAIDEDLVGDCNPDKSSVSHGLDHAKEQDQAEGEGDNALTDSFLNMSHLSTCLVHRNSLDGDEELDYHDDETGDDLTSSFTDSDFFRYDDADCNPSTFDGEDDESNDEDSKSGRISKAGINEAPEDLRIGQVLSPQGDTLQPR